jgi:MYXO-CTERM domain-containing protein
MDSQDRHTWTWAAELTEPVEDSGTENGGDNGDDNGGDTGGDNGADDTGDGTGGGDDGGEKPGFLGCACGTAGGAPDVAGLVALGGIALVLARRRRR